MELVKGKALIQHTAGKNLIADACQHYLAALGSLNQVEQHLMNNSFSGEGNTGTSSSNSGIVFGEWFNFLHRDDSNL